MRNLKLGHEQAMAYRVRYSIGMANAGSIERRRVIDRFERVDICEREDNWRDSIGPTPRASWASSSSA